MDFRSGFLHPREGLESSGPFLGMAIHIVPHRERYCSGRELDILGFRKC
jgi:hypothetical protein